MQERQVTVEGETFPLPAPFHVLATANPIEYEGTYPLPEAQLDRFLLRVASATRPQTRSTTSLTRRLARRREEVLLERITDADGLLAMQEAVEGVVVDESVGRYCVALVAATREHPDVLTGASPRGSLGLVLAARAFALLRGRDYVIPEDVKAVARPVLAHRITVKPELWMTQASGRRVVDAVLGRCRPPATLRGSGAMTGWRPTAALSRALLVGGPRGGPRGARGPAGADGAGGAVRAARGARPRPPARLSAPGCRPGWTTGRCTRARAPSPASCCRRRRGRRAGHPGGRRRRRTSRCIRGTGAGPGSSADGPPELEVSPRRWGRRMLGEEKVGLTAPGPATGGDR